MTTATATEAEMREAIELVLTAARLRIAETGRRWLAGKRWLLGLIASDAARHPSHVARDTPLRLAAAMRRDYASADQLRDLLSDVVPVEVPGYREGWRERTIEGWLTRAEAATDEQVETALLNAYVERVAPLLRASRLVDEADAALAAARESRDAAIRAARAAGQPAEAIADLSGLKIARVHEILSSHPPVRSHDCERCGRGM